MGTLCVLKRHAYKDGFHPPRDHAPMMRHAAPSRAHPIFTNFLKQPQHLQPFEALRTFRGLRRLMCWAALGIFLSVESASSLPSQQGHPSAPLSALAAEWQQPYSASSFLKRTELAEPRESVNVHKSGRGEQQGSPKDKPAVDPFSAAQMLSLNKYKKQLRARIHLHNWSGKDKSNLADITGKRVNAASLLARRQKKVAGNRVKTKPHKRSAGESSWIQLSSSARVGDAGRSDDDTTELKIPLRLADSQVKSHFPVLSEFYAEEQELDDDEKAAGDQGVPLKQLPEEKQAPAASLVQASASGSAKETSEEEAEPEEHAEHHEHGSTANHGSAEESESKAESSKEGEEAESGKAATGKEGVHEEGGKHEAGKKAEEHHNHHAEKTESEELKMAPGEEEEEQPSVGELTQSLNIHGSPQKSEIVPLHTGAASAGTQVETAAAKEVKSSKKEEEQVAHPAEKHAAEPVHKKTEEEEREEHRKHTKELADRATKLANIQRMEQEALLKLHMLGEGGPRENAAPPSGTSSMSVQDQEQHKQLEEATKTAQNLAAHLRVQHELKQREIALKQKEIAHLNLLKHIQVLMQSAVASVWNKLTNVQATLRRLVQQSSAVNKKFLRETDNRVLRPQEIPNAVSSEEERKREGVLAKKEGVAPLDCPVECAPKTCDNKPSFPTHCFRYDLVAGGGGFRTCAPFADETTAACPESYTRCAMAAPVRGRRYEVLTSTRSNPIPQALFIMGNNMHSCLRLMAVHKKTECTPSDTQSVLAAVQDSQTTSNMPPPRILGNGAIFENIQIGAPGEYKLCMLQFWVPPSGPKDSVVVLGVDEIGTISVQDLHPRKPAATETQAEKAAEVAEEETIEINEEQKQPQPAGKEEAHANKNVAKPAAPQPAASVKESEKDHTNVEVEIHKDSGKVTQ